MANVREKEQLCVHLFKRHLPVVYYVLHFILDTHMIQIYPLFSNSSQSHEFAKSKCHLDSALHIVIGVQWIFVG